jgi:hypothetical protein
MGSSDIEQRLQVLEHDVAELKQRLETTPSPTEPWWRKISGTFANDPAYEEAMRLGRQWRERENARSLRKNRRARKKKPKNVRS